MRRERLMQVLGAIAVTGLTKSGFDYLTLPPPAEDLVARHPNYLSSNPLTAPKPYANLRFFQSKR